MAPIPQTVTQPTVAAIYAAYEREADTENRPHLGASLIGRECSRALFYTFRWAGIRRHTGRLYRLFERGQREEAVFVENMRAAGVTVHDVDPQTGRQFSFSDLGGHFGGSMDACAQGIVEAPVAWHCCEYKTHNAKSFAKLESEGVEKSKPEHAAQMQCYMHWSGLDRAFYLAVNKDTDALYSERLRYDKAKAEALIDKARRIITAQEPLARLSERPDWYQCKWCDHYAICHQGAIPAANCRTCAHSTPELDGNARWSCARFGCDIAAGTQRQGGQCPGHVFIPSLLPWQTIDASEDGGWIDYRLPDGRTLRNGGDGYASRELAANVDLCAAGVGDPVIEEMRGAMGAEVIV